MNLALKIRDLNQEIESILEENVNLETGEINEIAFKQIEGLELSKEEIIHQVGLSAINFANNALSVDAEIKRLQSIKKARQSASDWLKKQIRSLVKEDEKFSFNDLEIKWGKSKRIVAEDVNLKELSRSHPHLVNVEYKLNKTECKMELKESGVLPEGITEIENKNIQIK